MKNNALRNKLGLYIEGIRQSRVIGVPVVCLGALVTIFDIVGMLEQPALRKQTISPDAMAAVMLSVSMVAVPVMLLMLFNFLNSRRASDFYHSIPRSRSALYLSFGGAAVTWCFAAMLAYSLVEIIFGLMLGCQVDWALWAETLFAVAAVDAFIAGGVLFAISISSTIFSQVVISTLLLFLPWGLLAAFESTVTTIVPILPSFEQTVGIFGSAKANILIGMLIYSMEDADVWMSSAYSLVVGIIYAALGMLFFNRRKSESAASPALNHWVQTAVRVIIAFVICLVPTMTVAERVYNGIAFDAVDSITTIAVFYGVAVIAYFVYEALSNRSIRGMWKSWRSLLIGLAVLVALNLGFIFGAGVCANAVLSFYPDNDEVASISFPEDNRYVASYDALRVAETELTDDGITGLLAEQMCKSVDGIRDISQGIYNGDYNSSILVQFTLTNGRTVTRNVYMSYAQEDKLNEKLHNNADYVAARTDCPKEYTSLYVYTYAGMHELTDEEIKALYECYVAERAETDSLQYLLGDYSSVATIGVYGKYNGVDYNSDYDIYANLPRTVRMLAELSKPEITLEQALKQADDATYFMLEVTGCNFTNGGEHYNSWNTCYESYSEYYIDGDEYYDDEYYKEYGTYPTASNRLTSSYSAAASTAIDGFMEKEENRELLLAELIANEGRTLDSTKPFYMVSVNVESEDDGEFYYNSYAYFIQAADEGSCLEMPEFVADA